MLGAIALLKFGKRFRMAVASPFVGGAEPLYSTANLSFSKITHVVFTAVPFEKSFEGFVQTRNCINLFCFIISVETSDTSNNT